MILQWFIYFSVSHIRLWAPDDQHFSLARYPQHLVYAWNRAQGNHPAESINKWQKERGSQGKWGWVLGGWRRGVSVSEQSGNNNKCVSWGWRRRWVGGCGDGDVWLGRGWGLGSHHFWYSTPMPGTLVHILLLLSSSQISLPSTKRDSRTSLSGQWWDWSGTTQCEETAQRRGASTCRGGSWLQGCGVSTQPGPEPRCLDC